MPPVPCNSTYDCDFIHFNTKTFSTKYKQWEIHKMFQNHSMFNTPFTFTHIKSWWVLIKKHPKMLCIPTAPQSMFSRCNKALSLTYKNTSYLKLYRSWILFKSQQSSGKFHHHLTFFTLSPTNLAWNWFHLEQNFRRLYKMQYVKY